MQGIKHVVECHCVLPQYQKAGKPYHQFVVFSILDDSDTCIPKHASCNNCGVIHNVIDICKSEILPGQETGAVMEISDAKLMLPTSLGNILESYNCEIHTWEHVLFLFENQMWDTKVILTKETTEIGDVSGKLLHLRGPGQYRLEPYIYRRVVQ